MIDLDLLFLTDGYQDRGRAHQFALSLGSLGGYIAPPEGMTMVREQKSGAGTNAQRSRGSQVGSGDLQARIAALRSLPREKLADAVFMLWMETQRQSKLIRRAATERVEGDTGPEPIPNADLATYLADEAVSSLRHHEVDIPSLADVLIQRSREVRFTVDRAGAVTLLAAMIQEQRLEGILEGLRLAGLLSEPFKDRHAGITL
ncbi:hypothetical protein AB7008_15410 [Bradyrhizobium sp. 521_C7_N1_3]|uniref:hypothetical protein n=1 Tax=Bradyrhizobium TaxID=374 RepID=UPI002715135B|nr:hypothetical protein [Bradyrhizobium japonicum]WLB52020.1 hypothetical protein QIH94_32330 [Bradyrhizobium japonicum]WLB66207.1 hypothetical protein QIH96_13990 [Bradyrhizobium japonicum]